MTVLSRPLCPSGASEFLFPCVVLVRSPPRGTIDEVSIGKSATSYGLCSRYRKFFPGLYVVGRYYLGAWSFGRG